MERQEQRSGTSDHELGLIMNIDHELTLPDSIQTIIDAYISQHRKDYVTKCIIKITEIIIKRTQQSPFLEQETLKLFAVENTLKLTKKFLMRFVEYSKQQM